MSRTLIAGLMLACFGIAGAQASDGKSAGEKPETVLGSAPHYKQWKGHPGRASVAAQRERIRAQASEVNGGA